MKKLLLSDYDIATNIFLLVVFAALLLLLTTSAIMLSSALWGTFGGFVTMVAIVLIGYVYTVWTTRK